MENINGHNHIDLLIIRDFAITNLETVNRIPAERFRRKCKRSNLSSLIDDIYITDNINLNNDYIYIISIKKLQVFMMFIYYCIV